jgi:hypothetical protein
LCLLAAIDDAESLFRLEDALAELGICLFSDVADFDSFKGVEERLRILNDLAAVFKPMLNSVLS